MVEIQLPFVCAIVLAITLAILFTNKNRPHRAIIIFVATSMFAMTLVGLRWSLEWGWINYVQAFFAACIPAITRWGFGIATQGDWKRAAYIPLLGLPTILFLVIPQLSDLTDIYLLLLYIYYGAALIRMGLQSSDKYEYVVFNRISVFKVSVVCAAALIIFSGVIDILVMLALQNDALSIALSTIAAGQTITLFTLVVLVILATNGVPRIDNSGETPAKQQKTPLAFENQAIVDSVRQTLAENPLYENPDLNLNLLSRKVGLPSRKISLAINSIEHKNVSQFINEYRIQKARKLLVASDESITDIYEQVGFYSKSNFNREFARITNTSPSQYRKSNGAI